jgi:hypothetical protein
MNFLLRFVLIISAICLILVNNSATTKSQILISGGLKREHGSLNHRIHWKNNS